jgi:hypothetical protein
VIFHEFTTNCFAGDGFSYNIGLLCVELKNFFGFKNDNQIVWIGSILVGMTFCAGEKGIFKRMKLNLGSECV